VVSSRLRTGVPYANLDGVTGLTFAPRDAQAFSGALNALLADDELRRRLGRQAQERALAEFTIPQMVDAVTCVYREAIAQFEQRSFECCQSLGGTVLDETPREGIEVDRENVDGV